MPGIDVLTYNPPTTLQRDAPQLVNLDAGVLVMC
jgi:hypothetical protein